MSVPSSPAVQQSRRGREPLISSKRSASTTCCESTNTDARLFRSNCRLEHELHFCGLVSGQVRTAKPQSRHTHTNSSARWFGLAYAGRHAAELDPLLLLEDAGVRDRHGVFLVYLHAHRPVVVAGGQAGVDLLHFLMIDGLPMLQRVQRLGPKHIGQLVAPDGHVPCRTASRSRLWG